MTTPNTPGESLFNAINNQTSRGPILGQVGPRCPLCKGGMVPLTAGSRGTAFGGGNILGAFSKSLVCKKCGHLA